MTLRPALTALAAFLSLLSCADGSPRAEGDPDGDAAAGDNDGGDGDTDPQRRCYGAADAIRVGTAQTLDPIVEAPERCLLYGADATESEVYFIDTAADAVREVVSVGAQPTDLALSSDGEQLYVAVLGASAIVVLDAEDASLVRTVQTVVPPYRIAAGPGDHVFYVEEDIFSAVRDVNLITGDDFAMTGVEFHEPDLESTADGTLLYVGEANLPGSKLICFDAGQGGLPEVDRYRFDGGFTLPSPQRRIVLAESANRVFFADRSFHADDLERMVGWLGDQVVAATADGSILATDESLYDGETFVRFANRPYPGKGALFSADGKWIYEFSPVGSQLYRTAVSTLVGVHRLGETNVPPGSLAQHNFTQILADPVRPMIYALDAQQNQLVYIDRNLMLPVRAEIIGSSPTDMAMSSDHNVMVIATFGATSISVIDLTTAGKALKQVLPVPGNPFRVTLGSSGWLVYAEQDQYSDVTLVDFDSGEAVETNGTVFQPDVELDPTGRWLYAGESAGPQAKLRRFDLAAQSLNEVGVTAAFSYPARRVIYHDGAVYFAGRKFDAETLTELGSFGEDIMLVTPDGRFAVSRRRIYDAATYAAVGGLPVDSGLLAADPSGTLIYQFDNDTGALFVQALPAS